MSCTEAECEFNSAFLAMLKARSVGEDARRQQLSIFHKRLQKALENDESIALVRFAGRRAMKYDIVKVRGDELYRQLTAGIQNGRLAGFIRNHGNGNMEISFCGVASGRPKL